MHPRRRKLHNNTGKKLEAETAQSNAETKKFINHGYQGPHGDMTMAENTCFDKNKPHTRSISRILWRIKPLWKYTPVGKFLTND